MNSTILGIILGIIGGSINAIWPLTINDRSPALIRITRQSGWHQENVFFVFGLLQLIILYSWFAIIFQFHDLIIVVQQSNFWDILLVCVFGMIWGLGTYTYVLAAKLAGPAISASLVISLCLFIGTILPLVYNYQKIENYLQLGILVVGIFLSFVGFLFNTKAGLLKQQQQEEDNQIDVVCEVRLAKIKMADSFGSLQSGSEGCLLKPSQERIEESVLSQESQDRTSSPKQISGVLICILSGVCSSMVQFAFVFGGNLIQTAESLTHTPPTISPLVVWIFIMTIEAAIITLYSTYQLLKNKTFSNFIISKQKNQYENRTQYQYISAGEFICNMLKCLFMTFLMFCNIQLYGVSQAFMGVLGPALAWPLMALCCVFTGQVCSVLMKEWVNVSQRAWNYNLSSFVLFGFAAAMIALAGVVNSL